MRAKTVIHVEYEILKHILENVSVGAVRDRMVTDDVSEKRFLTGGENVLNLIRNLADRRKNRLPQEHEDYHAKEASE